MPAFYDEKGDLTCVVFTEVDPQPAPTEYKITLRDKSVDRVTLGLWLRQTGFKCTYLETLYIADRLILGETWRPEYDSLKISDNPYCDIEVE